MTELVTPEPSMEAPAAEVAMPNKSWLYLFGLSLSVMIGGLSSVCIKQLLLPIQVGQLAPHDKNTVLALIASVGALAGLLVLPLIGALSDRTILRTGRRRPWIAWGIAVAVGGMCLMAFAHSIPLLLIGEIGAQAGVVSVLTVTTALLPDQVPPAQRRLVAACVGMAPNVGGVIGLLLVARLTDTRIIAEGYVLMAAISLGCVMLFLAILEDPPVQREEIPSFHLKSFLVSFVRPLRVRDFTFTLLSRCCAYLSFTILGTYMLFYVQDALHAINPATSVANFQLLSTTVLLVSALVAGWLSKRVGRLKPFAIGGAMGMAIGLGIMALIPNWAGLFLAAALFGAGFGLFLGVDIALAVRVLPSAQARAKDLGIMYDAIYLSLIMSPII
ncbi:MAG TPA: MFS transporter, partial [Ktedonobacteraceae bacterium]